MKYQTENDVQKLDLFIRVLAAFILLCIFFALAELVFAVVTEPFHPLSIVGVIVIGFMVHFSGSVVFKGYAPKYLLFTHGQK